MPLVKLYIGELLTNIVPCNNLALCCMKARQPLPTTRRCQRPLFEQATPSLGYLSTVCRPSRPELMFHQMPFKLKYPANTG